MNGIRAPRAAAARVWPARACHAVITLAIVTLLAACEGGSGQSGSAFTFLSVDGFSLSTTGSPIVSSIPSSTVAGTTTTACVTLRNNLKNPTVTMSNALDNIIVTSYTVTITSLTGGRLGDPFTIGTAVLVPAGLSTTTNDQTSTGTSTATFSVLLVPSTSKGSPGTVATVDIKFRGHDGRGSSVQAEGAVSVVFTSGLSPDTSCPPATAPTTPTTPTPPA
jgi:hypothetical protein